jgi:catechol 2,3-dioxygenase-like lactoylglutathione lyase family enzyme
MYKRINGLQHIGVAVNNMDASLAFYRKYFGLDIPFFDSVQAAPLMDFYTNNKTITKRASMIMNLQGGCAIEVIRPTSFEPSPAKHPVQLGDLGIFITTVKCKDIKQMWAYCKAQNPPYQSPIGIDPAGGDTFYIKDLDNNLWQYVMSNEWYTQGKHLSGGVVGCTTGVRDIERAKKLYCTILGFDEVVYDKSGKFNDWSHLPLGNENYRRVLLTQSAQPGGGFAKVTGKTYIELVQALDHEPNFIFEDRIWADSGFVHIGFDVKGMKALGEDLAAAGYPFTCDSQNALSMGQTKVHCTYIHDDDRTLIEMIEVYKVPIIEKWGIFLNVEKRDPLKPLPDFMLKALRFSRVKEKNA